MNHPPLRSINLSRKIPLEGTTLVSFQSRDWNEELLNHYHQGAILIEEDDQGRAVAAYQIEPTVHHLETN